MQAESLSKLGSPGRSTLEQSVFLTWAEFLLFLPLHWRHIAPHTPRGMVFSVAIACRVLIGAIQCCARSHLFRYLSLEACHGRVGGGWTIDAALHPWREGTRLLVPGDVAVHSADRVLVKGEPWEILECSCSLAELAHTLQAPSPSKL